MGCGSSIETLESGSSHLHLDLSYPRNALVRANRKFVREAAVVQEFSNVAVSHHVKLASNRPRIKPQRDTEIQQQDLLWDRKLKIFPNLNDLNLLDQKAINAPAQLENDANRLVTYLVHGVQNQAFKARVLAMWIASHIKYDNTLDSKNQKVNDLVNVFKTKKALCGGYCRLFEHFCSLVGIQCKYISGLARSGNFDPCTKFNVDMMTGQLVKSDPHEHAWNIVLVENQWHMIDLTWSAGTLGDDKDGSSQEFQFKWQEEWFFCEPYSFVFTHFPYKNRMPASTRQNITKPMTVKNWTDSAVFTSVFFDYGLQALSHSHLWIQADNYNCAEIKFNSAHDMNFHSKLSKNGVVCKDSCCVSVKNGVVGVKIVLPEAGKFKFELWASLAFAEDTLKDVKPLCVYGIEGTYYNQVANAPFPKGAWPYWGPTYVLDYLGLLPMSHWDPRVDVKGGVAELTFKIKNTKRSTPKLMFSLHKGDDLTNLKRQFCAWVENGKIVHLRVFLTESGSYRLTIFGKSKRRVEWNRAANYLLEAKENDLFVVADNDDVVGYRFPVWPHLLGPTDQLGRLGIGTMQQEGYLQVKGGVFELQFYLEKWVNIEHSLFLLDNANDGDEPEPLRRCVYASVDGAQRWVTYSIRMPGKGSYFFRLSADVYEYEEEAMKRPWLANYLLENSKPYEGGLFPVHQGLWGLTPEGLEFGLKIVDSAGSTIRMTESKALLELKIEDTNNAVAKADNGKIVAILENGKGDSLSTNFFKLKTTDDMVAISIFSLKPGYYKLILKSNKVTLGTFLVVST